MQDVQLWALGLLVSSCHRLKMVLNRDCTVQKSDCGVVGSHQFSECNPVLCCVWEALLLGCKPPCSSRFACLGSHPSFANCIGFTFEVIAARHRNYSGPFETRSLKQSRLQASSKLLLDAVEKSEAAKLSVATTFPNAIHRATNFTQTPKKNKNEFWNCHLAMLGRVAKPTFTSLCPGQPLIKSMSL